MKSKKVLLFVVLLGIAIISSGCSVANLIPNLPTPSDSDEIKAVLRAFVDAVDQEDQQSLEGTLAETTSLAVALYDVNDGNLSKAQFVQNLFGKMGNAIDARFTAGPAINVTGDSASATGKVYLKYFFEDSNLPPIQPPKIDANLGVEDNYDVEFALTKVGGDWLISTFRITGGDRHDEILPLIQAFCNGMESENTTAVLATVTDPFQLTRYYDDGYNMNDMESKATWQTFLNQMFTQNDAMVFDIQPAGTMELTADGGIILGWYDGDGDDTADELVYIKVSNDDGWLIHIMNFVSLSPVVG